MVYLLKMVIFGIYYTSSKVSWHDLPPKSPKPKLGVQAGAMFWPGSEPSPHVAKAGRAPEIFKTHETLGFFWVPSGKLT
jgi:hypothetical protein